MTSLDSALSDWQSSVRSAFEGGPPLLSPTLLKVYALLTKPTSRAHSTSISNENLYRVNALFKKCRAKVRGRRGGRRVERSD